MAVQHLSSSLPPIVLVVDFDRDTRELYETAFGLAGLWTAEAADPDDAFSYAAELRPNGIVLDPALPSPAEGLRLARQMHDDARLTGVPLVAATSLGLDTLTVDGVFTEIFSKPVQLDPFVRHVRWLAARCAVLRERSERARAKVPRLIEKSGELRSRAAAFHERISSIPLEVRACPQCRKALRFVERRQLDGVLFDYYSPCPSGCGLYCYDHSRRKLISLVP
jgi:DNA-binding response OmpR family regulator